MAQKSVSESPSKRGTGHPVPNEIRRKIVADSQAGLKQTEIAIKHGISQSVVSLILNRHRLTGNSDYRKPGKPPLDPRERFKAIEAYVLTHPDCSIEQIREALNLTLAKSYIWTILNRLGFKLGWVRVQTPK